MPIYVKKCSECSLTKEVLEPISEDKESNICPSCGKKTWVRIPATSSFTISGYSYRNGYTK